ncbi:MAG: acyltransferase [Rubrobacter sp.]|nr:acyltransferase [Rubrobacter sp.]MDQ3360583.1 acyltransferase [Actinomycetota bacterium]
MRRAGSGLATLLRLVAGKRREEPSGRPPSGSGKAPSGGGFRPDVEGLRAVAVACVLLYHAGIPFAGGGYVGVDVFFVISGYLITGLLLRELEKTGTVSLARFYSRRAKRLLPLTVVVLAFVVVLSWLLFDPIRMDETSFGVVAAGLYVMNWLLAVEAADYFAAGLQASPVQHFWTLAVEEQFYLVWPALLLAVGWWCRRTGRGLRPTLAAVLAAVAASSLAYGVYSTDAEAGAAYFSTLTRGWELALGGMLALAPASALGRLPGWMAGALAWAGLGAVAFAAHRFNDDTLFPGTAALIPTLGTAAIIAAGLGAGTGSATPLGSRLLALGPVRHVGRISYSWYLWHWPPLVFAAAVWGKLSPVEGLAVLAASYVPAVLTHHLVEKPFLHSRSLTRYPRKALALGGACTAASIALGLILFALTPIVPEAPETRVAGAAALRDGHSIQKSAKAVNPTPREAETKENRPRMYADGCHLNLPETESPECVYGNPSSDTTVVLFGDSHAMQWFPALNELAKERDWRLVGFSKSACPPAEISVYSTGLRREYRECEEWRERTLGRIVREENPSLVVTSMLNRYRAREDGKGLDRNASNEAVVEGYASTLKKLRGSGAPVAVIEDVPSPGKNVPKCVSRSLDRLQDCAFPRKKALDQPRINVRAAREVEGVSLVDPTPVVCPEKTCPAVIGDVLVYRNGAHLTRTYVNTLTPWLGERLPDPAGS